MTRRSEMYETTDLEALDGVAEPNSMPLDKCKKGFRKGVHRAHDREYMNITNRPVTLPKLKFLEGKDL